MVRAPKRNSKKAKARATIGVRAAARQIGVSHSHLSRVLRGERHSRSLTQRYNQLKAAA